MVLKGTLCYPTNKTYYHDITGILLKVALNTITLTHIGFYNVCYFKLQHNVVSSIFPHEWGSNSTLMVIGTDWKSNYHMTTMTPYKHWLALYHIMLYWVHLAWAGLELTLVVISTDCIGSCKSNYHVITTAKAPLYIYRF
jgi:hypothetical protein